MSDKKQGFAYGSITTMLFIALVTGAVAFLIGGYTSKHDIVKKHKASLSYNSKTHLKEHYGSN